MSTAAAGIGPRARQFLRESAALRRLHVESFVRPVSSVEIHAVLNRERLQQARRARRGRERFTIIDAGYPRPLWLVFDHSAKAVVPRAGERYPWFTTRAGAEREAARLARG